MIGRRTLQTLADLTRPHNTAASQRETKHTSCRLLGMYELMNTASWISSSAASSPPSPSPPPCPLSLSSSNASASSNSFSSSSWGVVDKKMFVYSKQRQNRVSFNKFSDKVVFIFKQRQLCFQQLLGSSSRQTCVC